MGSGAKPDLQRRGQAAQLRAGGLSLRLAAGLTRAALARRAGVREVTVKVCEGQPRRPWARTMQRLAEALGVPAEQLAPG